MVLVQFNAVLESGQPTAMIHGLSDNAAVRGADVPSRVCLRSRPVTGTTDATGSAARRAPRVFAAVVELRHTT